MDPFSLSSRVILLTGATGHLGSAIHERLSAAGAVVLVNSRSEARAQEAASARGGEPLAFDITSGEEVAEACRRVQERHGRLDGIVNNAYSGKAGHHSLISEDDFTDSLHKNITAPFLLVRQCTPLLKASAHPAIVNISSMYGLVSPDPRIYGTSGLNNPPHYGAGKAGMLQLSRYMAVHLAPEGIRVNAVAPGPFPKVRYQAEQPEFLGVLAERVPLGRIGSPHELAGAIQFLLSDAASYITGVTLPVDGGWTAW